MSYVRLVLMEPLEIPVEKVESCIFGKITLVERCNWLVCLLRANERPFRHLFIIVDGKTSGPTSFIGPIGKVLHLSATTKICNFMPIETNLPDITSDLINDHK